MKELLRKVTQAVMKKNVLMRGIACLIVLWILYPLILTCIFSLLKSLGVTNIVNFNYDKLGIFGDLFGSLNAIFSGLALIGIAYSIYLQQEQFKLQSKELKDNTELLKKQNFEYYFFQDISRLREVRKSIFIKGGSHNFEIDKKQFSFQEEQDSWGDHAISILHKHCTDWFFDIKKDKQGRNQYEKLYDEFLYKSLGSYYRVLYNLIKNIDLSEELKDSDKTKYVHLVRAELSNSELYFLLYNGLSIYGEKFKPLLEKYEMFEHYHDNETSVTLLIKYNEKALGSNEELKIKCREHNQKVDNNPNKKTKK